MLQLRTRRLIRVAITAASALALCAGSAAAAPKTDNGNGSASSAHGSQKVDDHQPAGGGTGRRIG
jgi:hypothetical protein